MERDFNGYRHMRDAARRLRREMTWSEQRIWAMLSKRQCAGLRFRRQAPMGQYIVDFYCPSCRLLIEIDGSIHEEDDVKQRDQVREEVLIEMGLTILRLTNEEANIITPKEFEDKIVHIIAI
jgi:very-short-patch-repair endonuclease